VAAPYPRQERRAAAIGIAGDLALLPGLSDIADFWVAAPFAMSLTKIKATCKVAPSTPLRVQLRRSVASNPAVFSDVATFFCVFTPGNARVSAVVTPAVDVDEGDLFNLSISDPSGSNLLVEVIGDGR
jgi:hypothetical protein